MRTSPRSSPRGRHPGRDESSHRAERAARRLHRRRARQVPRPGVVHGPVVDDPDWDDVATAARNATRRSASDAAKDCELAGDVANERLTAFAARHGFVAGKVHTCSRSPARVERLQVLDSHNRPSAGERVHRAARRALPGHVLLGSAAAGPALALYDPLGFGRLSAVGYRRRRRRRADPLGSRQDAAPQSHYA